MYVSIYIPIYAYVCIYIYMRVCFYLHMHLHTYNTDMYIHILRLHTHTCAYDSLDIFGIFLKMLTYVNGVSKL